MHNSFSDRRAIALAAIFVLTGCSDAPDVERSLRRFVSESPPEVPLYVTSVACQAPVTAKPQPCTVTFNPAFGVPDTVVQISAREKPFPSKFKWTRHYEEASAFDNGTHRVHVETAFDGKSLHIVDAGRYLTETITAAHDAAVVKHGALYQQKLQLLKNLDSYR